MPYGISPEVERRVRDNLQFGPWDLKDEYRRAGAYLFSTLGYLEEIAVMASSKGQGSPNQYEDEIVHRETFFQIADRLDLQPHKMPEPIRDLLEFLGDLTGQHSLLALNLIAENWLATLFRHIGKWNIAPGLFSRIEQEEIEHADYAQSMAHSYQNCETTIRLLEELLTRVLFSPDFLIPLTFLSSIDQVSLAGRDTIKKHKELLAFIDLKPSSEIKRLRAAILASRMASKKSPRKMELTGWDRTKMQLYDTKTPMRGWIEVEMDRSSPPWVEVLVTQALGNALARVPRANCTRRNAYLFQPKHITIGLRRFYDESGQLVTVYIRNPHQLSPEVCIKKIGKRLRKIREDEYPELPKIAHLWEFLPPPQSSFTVTNVGVWSKDVYGGGEAPLNELEGNAGSITIGPVVDKKAIISFVIDHRCMDGREMVMLMREMGRELGSEKQCLNTIQA